MSTDIREAPIVGVPPTPDEAELIGWVEEARRKGLQTVGESLRHMVTLTTALLAGSAVLFAQPVVPAAFKAAGAALLMLSLASALYGSLPREMMIDAGSLDHARYALEAVSRGRMRALRVSSLSLFAAFAAVFAGLAYSAFAG